MVLRKRPSPLPPLAERRVDRSCFAREAGAADSSSCRATWARIRDSIRVPEAVRPIFVFGDEPAPMVFPSLGSVIGWMEAIDVDNGVYEALYTLDGHVVTATTSGNNLILEVSPERNEADLRQRIRRSASGGHVSSDPDDLTAVANEFLRARWDNRWPKRPRWLSRRIHGDGPQQV